MVKSNRDAERIAWELRQEFRARGPRFLHADYVVALEQRLCPLKDRMFGDAVRGIADKVDREAAPDLNEESSKPFRQREMFDLDDEIRLGGGQRVAKRFALIGDGREALEIARANRDRVAAAYKIQEEELARLEKYWDAPGVTMQQAVAAYFAANPPQTQSEGDGS